MQTTQGNQQRVVKVHEELEADIRSRDWWSVHYAGDRNPPIVLGPRLPWRRSGGANFFRRGRAVL